MTPSLPLIVRFSREYGAAPDPRCTAWPLIELGFCEKRDKLPGAAAVLTHHATQILRPGAISREDPLVVLDVPYRESREFMDELAPEQCFRLPLLVGRARDDERLSTAEALIAGAQILGFPEQAEKLARVFEWGPAFLRSNFGLMLPQTLPPHLSGVLSLVSCAVVDIFKFDHHSLLLMGSTLSDEITKSHDIDLLWVVESEDHESFSEEELQRYRRGHADACFVSSTDPRLAELSERLARELGADQEDVSVTWEFAGVPYWGTIPARQHLHLHFFGPMSVATYARYRSCCPVFAEHQVRTGRVLAGKLPRDPRDTPRLGAEDFRSTLGQLRKRTEEACRIIETTRDDDERFHTHALILVKSLVGVATLVAASMELFTDHKLQAVEYVTSKCGALHAYAGFLELAYKLKVRDTVICASDVEDLLAIWPALFRAAEGEL